MRALAILAGLAVVTAPDIAAAGGQGSCIAELGKSPDAEALYDAGVCLEQDKSIGPALRVYENLVRRHPRSPLARKAQVRAAVLYEAIAMFDRAARLYQSYARRYGGERDAPDALRQAIALFAATGDRRRALRGVDAFVRSYGRKRAGDAAEVFFAAAQIHERAGDDDALVAHLERYLARFGARGGRDRAAIAHARIGEILWKRSCPLGDGGVDRLCRARSRSRSRSARCDPAVLETRRVARDRALVKRAQKHLSKALRIYRPPPRPSSLRERAAALWRARAELTRLEADFEDYVDDGYPRRLDFDRKNRELRSRSVERFTRWLGRKRARARTLRAAYLPHARRAGETAAWAAARIAGLTSHLRNQLAGSTIPASLRRGRHGADLEKAYCAALETHLAPLEKVTITAHAHCVTRPGSNRWSRRCAAELVRLAPKQHPPAREVHGAAIHLGPIIETAGAVN